MTGVYMLGQEATVRTCDSQQVDPLGPDATGPEKQKFPLCDVSLG